jgi:hypothetical protein
VIVPVFKTGGRQVFLSLVGSTPTRFRHGLTTWRATNRSRPLAQPLSSARLGDYVSGVRGVCFHMIVEVLAGEGTVCTGVTGAKISRFAMRRMAAVELAPRGAGRGIGRQGKQQSEEHRSTQHADESHCFPS